MNEKKISQKCSVSGSTWDKIDFLDWATNNKVQGEPYNIDMMKFLKQLKKSIQGRFGKQYGGYIFFKSIVWDMVFNRPKWRPEMFNLDNSERTKFYKAKFKEFMPFIILFNNLQNKMTAIEADRFIAAQMMPLTLDMMKSRFHPVKEIDNVEVWLKQARDYLGDEVEKNKGFEGKIYLAKDKSEMRFHVTRCSNMEILRNYGLKFSAAALCMADHITYHTVFPNLIFKRCHSISVGNEYCDHEFRIRTTEDPIMDEKNYGDCYTVEGIRELVREWEEKAKIIHFGSKEKWDEYAMKYFGETK
ncbi:MULTISPECIES: L-2-amino-thiazoline-4-carboxylic acid hydrolase [unclassified Fusibacter]|uniref:L-2-amino-thiazoline-4-carboxylic acid hydrolase n=1 Tax=unclassified Fusibacter TaxID=2624464 RepID=UPI0013E9164F|nr:MULTISPECIES: L-2-amino-thiazoline-4-carboxylic acid hydrolase [unclassified Fusibacter]MCK8060250.1 L-2-amino-thiazoline-4-carboxylic acid hydrolase [Fusibacter sp. A2]NPE20462.1 hypothetical protein [Fusibacter sp. A1]